MSASSDPRFLERYAFTKRVLVPLIQRDFAEREQGLKPDEWYWADTLAMSWGLCVSPEGKIHFD